MSNKLTKNQAQLLSFISTYRLRYGIVPTLKEMVQELKVSDNKSVLGIIEALTKKDYITRNNNKKSRSILLTDKAIDYLRPYKYQKPTIPDRPKRPTQYSKNGVTVPSFTKERLTYKDNNIKTDSTKIEGDIQTIIETVVSLTIDRYFNRDSSKYEDLKREKASVSSLLISLLHSNFGTAEIFRWGLFLTFFAWLNSFVFKDINIVIAYSFLEAIIIKTILIGKENYESRN